ncbi:hypothetical protein AYO44_17390 [Planctomycetaceae bacterium SCGC AG-212-F19]|nr:hypothetical protein AYO44_17390 [Planctomycetaceae bacterium SCGC AG-212-F19]
MKTTLRIVGALLVLGGLAWFVSGAEADDATDWQNQLWQAQKERDDWLSKITQDNMDYGNQMRQEMAQANAWPTGPAAGPGIAPQVKAPAAGPAAAPKAVPQQPPKPQAPNALAEKVRQNQEQVRQRIEQTRQVVMQRRQEILQQARRALPQQPLWR